jgi:hypothetical protein
MYKDQHNERAEALLLLFQWVAGNGTVMIMKITLKSKH